MNGAGRVDGQQELKQILPYPFNQDLSQVLRRLDRRTVIGRERLANDPVTAAYLAAALRLVERHLGPGTDSDGESDPDPENVERPLLAFLSQRAVSAEVANNPDPFPRNGNVSTMRARWKSQSDFVGDLYSFVLWTAFYPARYDEVLAAAAERLAEGPDFSQAVQDIAYRAMEILAEMVSFRFMLVAVAGVDGDPEVHKALMEKYHRGRDRWKQVYSEFLAARGLRLRDGMTLDDLTNIITALNEGCALRSLSDPDADVIDEKNQRTLLGTAAQAILAGCLEPVEGGDGRNLAEALDAVIYRWPPRRTGVPPGP